MSVINVVTYTTQQKSVKVRAGNWKRKDPVKSKSLKETTLSELSDFLQGYLQQWLSNHVSDWEEKVSVSWDDTKQRYNVCNSEYGYDICSFGMKNGNISLSSSRTFMETHTNTWKTVCVFKGKTKVYLEPLFEEIAKDLANQ